MKDSQKGTENAEIIAEEGPVRTTIVGARPPARGRARGDIPRGIEVLVKKASIDPVFHALLLEKRAAAASALDLDLTPSEVATLNAVPRAQLEKIIANTRVPDPQRRAFLGQAGKVMLAAVALGVTGCKEIQSIYEDITVSLGNTVGDDRTILTPIPTKPVLNEGERIGIRGRGQGTDTVTVEVVYDCTFETGEIVIDFRESYDVPGSNFTYEPQPPVAVSRGTGVIMFDATAESHGMTFWIITGLRAATPACQDETVSSLLFTGLEAKEYVADDCAAWKIVYYPKTWAIKE